MNYRSNQTRSLPRPDYDRPTDSSSRSRAYGGYDRDRYGFNDSKDDYAGYKHNRPEMKASRGQFISASSGERYGRDNYSDRPREPKKEAFSSRKRSHYDDEEEEYLAKRENQRKRDHDERNFGYHRDREVVKSFSTLLTIKGLDKRIGSHNIRGYITNSGYSLKSLDMQVVDLMSGAQDCYVEFSSSDDSKKFIKNHSDTFDWANYNKCKINLNNIEYDIEVVDKSTIKGTEEYRLEQNRIEKESRMARMRETRQLEDKINYENERMIQKLNDIETPCPVLHVTRLRPNTPMLHVRSAFEYVSKYPIIDVRNPVQSRFVAHRKDTTDCYVEFSCIQHATEVLEYLLKARPRFHVDGAYVDLNYWG